MEKQLKDGPAATWRGRSTSGDPQKCRFSSVGGDHRKYMLTVKTLTARPQTYYRARPLRTCRGRTLIVQDILLRAETWLMVTESFSTMLEKEAADIDFDGYIRTVKKNGR